MTIKPLSKRNYAFTLIEILVVVGIIAILTAIVISIATHIRNKVKEQLAESTIATLTAALGEFQEYEYPYKHPDYSAFDFPLDCNNPLYGLIPTLGKEFNQTVTIDPVETTETVTHKQEYSGCEALYFFLNRIPTSRKIIEKIDNPLITDKDDDGYRMKITIGTREYPLLRVIDPWGKTLRYNYYKDETKPEERRNFPLITSAGPDKEFGTTDDITNK